MKRRFFNLMAVLMIALIFVIPAQAAEEAYVVDDAYLLTTGQRQELEQQAQRLFEQYGVGVYIATANDYRDYTHGDIYDATDYFYQGKEENGLMLLLSMDEREYCILAYGDYAQYAFNNAGLDVMEEFFLDDFGNDAWYDGFVDYLNWSGDYLEQAENGTPYSDSHVAMTGAQRTTGIMIRVAIMVLVPLLIAGGYVLYLSSKMKSVATAVEASAYVSGELNLTRSGDLYTHTTTVRERIEKDSESGSSSGGGSGRSGHF